MESTVAGVDGGEFYLFLDEPAILQRADDLDDHFISCHGRGPQLTAVLDVIDGEGADAVGQVGVVNPHLTIDRQHPAAEAEVHADGILAVCPESPHSVLVVELCPETMGQRCHGDRLGNCESWCQARSLAIEILQCQCLEIERWNIDDRNLLQGDVVHR